jgi:hypothetical protein
MKFRHVLLIFGGIAVGLSLVAVGIISRSQPKRYSFLAGHLPKQVTLEPDPVGLVGREAKFYVLHESLSKVTADAHTELDAKGWKELAVKPAVFGRGSHERIEVTPAVSYKDPSLLEGIAKSDLASYTVVKVVDPRMPPAFRQRMFRWTHHPFRRLLGHFV